MYIPHITATDHSAGLRTYQTKTQAGIYLSDVLITGLIKKLSAAGLHEVTSEPPHGHPGCALTLAETKELQRGLQRKMTASGM